MQNKGGFRVMFKWDRELGCSSLQSLGPSVYLKLNNSYITSILIAVFNEWCIGPALD